MSLADKNPVVMDATEMMKGLKPEDLKALLKSKISENMHQDASPAMQKRINALKHVQVSVLEVEAKFFEELHELECKYASTYEPFYEKRRKIVTGEYEPTDEEGKWTLGDDLDEPKDNKEVLALENGKEEEEEKGVKNFWLETLQSFRITSEIIQEHDEPILSYLQDIQVKLFDKKPYGYTLEFHFAENPYFTNKVLTKTYQLKIEVDSNDPFSYEGPDLEKATGCTINWNPTKNVCMKLVKKKLKSKNKKQPPKIVSKEEKQDSFFNFFETPKVRSEDSEDNKKVAKMSESEADEDDDAEHDADLYLIADFEIGQYLKEKIIPKAILFFTGDGVDDEFDEDDYEDEDEEDEEEGDEDDEGDEDEDDDDDEEEDDEDEVPKSKGKKKAKNGTKPKNGEPTPSECKQN